MRLANALAPPRWTLKVCATISMNDLFGGRETIFDTSFQWMLGFVFVSQKRLHPSKKGASKFDAPFFDGCKRQGATQSSPQCVCVCVCVCVCARARSFIGYHRLLYKHTTSDTYIC